MSQELAVKLCEIAAQTLADLLLIGVAAFFANIVLERYKANQTLRIEIAKRRVDKIDEMWLLFVDLETFTKSMFDTLYGQPPWEAAQAMAPDFFKQYSEISSKIDKQLQKNYSWLGESLSKTLSEYHLAIGNSMVLFATGDRQKANDRLKLLKLKRHSVLDFLKNPDV